MTSWTENIKEIVENPVPAPVVKEITQEEYLSSVFHAVYQGSLAPWISGLQENKISSAQLDPNGYTVLHMAAWIGDTQSVQYLLAELKIPVNIRSKNNQTPLALASAKGFLYIIKALVDSGADIEAKDDSGMTPILCAAHNGQVFAWFILKSLGANTRNTDAFGNTPVHLAASKNHVNMIRVLKNQFNLNELNTGGQTPLHKACENNSLDSIEFLLIENCSLDVKDAKNRDPLKLAEESEVEGPAEMIESFKNNRNWTPYFSVGYHLFWLAAGCIYLVYFVHETVDCLFSNLLFCLGLCCVIPAFWIVKKGRCEFIASGDEGSIEKIVVEAFNSGKFETMPMVNEVCFTCNVIRPQKSKHCRFRGTCVKDYDHYDWLLGKTIGKGNHKSYFFWLAVNLLLVWIFCFLFYVKVSKDLEYSYFAKYFVEVLYGYSDSVFVIKGVLVLCAVYGWVLFWHLFLQIASISQGLTANEALYRHRYAYLYKYKKVQEMNLVIYENPYNKGFIGNWLDFLVN